MKEVPTPDIFANGSASEQTAKAQPLVSVLMTCFNRKAFVAEAIESVLASTYQNFELIVVDDASSDGSPEVVERYCRQDSRVKLYINEKNLGDYPNRNVAASFANGEYLKYVDADDLIYPYGLQILLDNMEQFPEAGYGLCSFAKFDDRVFPFCLSPDEAYREHYFGRGLFMRAPLSSIIRKHAFKAIGGFREERHIGDMDMWHRLSADFPLVLMQDGVVWHRSHAGSEMAQRLNNRKRRVNAHIAYQRIVLRMLEGNRVPLTRTEIRQIARRYFLRNCRFAVSLAAKGELTGAGKIAGHAHSFLTV